MQILPFPKLSTGLPQDPRGVVLRLENLERDLIHLEQKLHDQTKKELTIESAWAPEVATAASTLRISGSALRSLGGAQEAIIGEALISDAEALGTFSRELAAAYKAQQKFGTQTSAWLSRFDTPIKNVQTALDIVESSPARP